uniref:Sugar phosphate transporter domain-containing protein n=1 Tax=Triticum urartu TaxID=4572 RepID=A0A8R7TFL5_TRIUA
MEPAEKKPPAVSDLGAWGMNVVSSVGLIMANKQLMSSAGYAFSFATTLTGFHFTVTALVGWISKATGYSASKHVPLWELVWFSLVANASITGMNLSLMLNSVGFYQISKLSMIPVVCLMEWVLNSKHYTTKVISAVVVVAAGVGICTVTDVEVNAKGFICACVAVFCTSLQQIVSLFSLSGYNFCILDSCLLRKLNTRRRYPNWKCFLRFTYVVMTFTIVGSCTTNDDNANFCMSL